MDSEKVERLRERLLQCAVCMDEYKDPRILPCHHTLCFECIQSVVLSSSASGRFFRCPQCRSDVCVPRGGVAELPINFYIISLQDELGTKGYSGTCDVCERDWLVSQFRCIDCDLDICRFCIHAHRLETHSEPPKILRIEATTSSVQLSSTRSCTEHADEILQMFCATCHEAICIKCSCNDHKRHNVLPISVKLEESKCYLQKELDRLTAEKRIASKVAGVFQEAKEEVVETSNQSLLALNDAAHQACELIMRKKTELEREILQSEKDQVGHIGDALKDFKLYMQRIDRGLAFLSDLQDTDICLEVVDTYKDFAHKMEDMRKMFTSNHLRIQHNFFHPSQSAQVTDVKLGLFRNIYFHGKLGNLSWRQFCLSIDPKSMTVSRCPRGVTRMAESIYFKQFLKFLFAFVFFQLLFWIGDVSGAFAAVVGLFVSIYVYMSTTILNLLY